LLGESDERVGLQLVQTFLVNRFATRVVSDAQFPSGFRT
jgi:hypothetical protein